MKKLLLPVSLIAILAIGSWFLFFADQGNEKSDAAKPQTETQADKSVVDVSDEPPSAEDLKKQQRLNEHARPYEFIKLDYEARRNLLGETILEGKLKNKAELTTYRDLQMMIYFESSDGTLLDSASQVIFKTLKPGEQENFRIKEKGPRKADVRLKLIEAKIEN